MLVTFLAEDEPSATESEPTEPGKQPVAFEALPEWPRDLVEFLLSAPDPLIERNQPAEAERRNFDL